MPTATPTPAPTLPPPQTFDILPPLHALLSRLLVPSGHDISTPSPEPLTSLSPKDLATAASGIMAKIQKARIVVRELPGMGMGIEEQEGIIVELEEEVRRLRGVEEGIGRAAREAWQKGIGTEGGKEDEMEGRKRKFDLWT